jgi:hypothetical protein
MEVIEVLDLLMVSGVDYLAITLKAGQQLLTCSRE